MNFRITETSATITIGEQTFTANGTWSFPQAKPGTFQAAYFHTHQRHLVLTAIVSPQQDHVRIIHNWPLTADLAITGQNSLVTADIPGFLTALNEIEIAQRQ